MPKGIGFGVASCDGRANLTTLSTVDQMNFS